MKKTKNGEIMSLNPALCRLPVPLHVLGFVLNTKILKILIFNIIKGMLGHLSLGTVLVEAGPR